MGLLPINLLIALCKLYFLSDVWTDIAEVNAKSSLHHLAKWTLDMILIVYWLNLVCHLIQDEILTKPSEDGYFQSPLSM